MVSVLMITYKHENFIAQAIEGVLEQKANFPFELIICEDASPDGTSKIIQKYKDQYPDKIIYVRNEVNIGMMQNFINGLKLSKSPYVAICDGDDYWCDESKLQKQVDFLIANAGFALCFHSVYELNEKGELSRNGKNTEIDEYTYSIDDLASGNIIHTPSVVFRNGLIKNFPAWYKDSPVGDYVLHMFNAKHGLIKYLPLSMAVYRVHNDGVWSGLMRTSVLDRWISMLNNLIKEHFDPSVKEKLFLQKRKYIVEYLRLLMQENDWQLFLDKLAIFSTADDYISQLWLIEYYPKYIQGIKKSRTYKLASSLQKIYKKFHK